MNDYRPVLWTDINLHPAVRARMEDSATIVSGGDLQRVEEADGIIAGALLPAGRELFSRAPRLQVIARVGAGYDNVDLRAATDAGVCAVHTPAAPTESTAEFTIGLMLALARRIALADRMLRADGWNSRTMMQGTDLAGKTLGLIGCGRIGSRVAEIALALHMEVRAYDPQAASLPAGVGRAESVAGIFSTCDVISLHLPLLPSTRGLIDGPMLRLAKPGAMLINASRGAVVDEEALIAALTEGRLGGAGIDTWAEEPVASSHPLLRLPNVVATPHVAAFTQESSVRGHGEAVAQVLQVWRGERPAALLNPEVWPHRRLG